jgi:hypothetical protein
MFSGIVADAVYRAGPLETAASAATSTVATVFYSFIVIVFFLWAIKALWSGIKDGSAKAVAVKVITGALVIILVGGIGMWLRSQGGEGFSQKGTEVVKNVTGQ